KVRLRETAGDAAIFECFNQIIYLKTLPKQRCENRAKWRAVRKQRTCANGCVRRVAKELPIHTEFARRVALYFDKADFEHHLLRLRHADGIDAVRAELFRDREDTVERHAVRGFARQHDAAID